MRLFLEIGVFLPSNDRLHARVSLVFYAMGFKAPGGPVLLQEYSSQHQYQVDKSLINCSVISDVILAFALLSDPSPIIGNACQ